jgi:hypothetical protein
MLVELVGAPVVVPASHNKDIYILEKMNNNSD